jgi:uridine kinase
MMLAMDKYIERFEQLREQLLSLPRRHATLLIGIDAPGGSGKSVFTQALFSLFPQSTIVQMDDFFLPSGQRLEGKPAAKPIGADFDWPRVYSQVLMPLLNDQEARYQRYDWDSDALAEWHRVLVGGTVFVEGVYALRNELVTAYDFTIWLECPRDIRLARGIARTGEKIREIWENDWMIAEDLYMATHRPCERASLVIDSSGALQHDLEREFVRLQ